MKQALVALIVSAVVLAAAPAGAYMFDGLDVIVEYWTGAGENEAMCVVDFGAHQYAFGYRWDGAKTGFDMISEIDEAGDLELVLNDFGWGVFVDGIIYDGNSEVGYQGDEDWWHYWTSEDGVAWPPSGVGTSQRTLTDGCWDGWSYGFAEAPDVPLLTLVPEPSSICALVIGLVALSVRRRTQR